MEKSVKERPTKEERKVLKQQGVNMKDYHAVIKATAELREKNKPAPVPPKPTQEELLTEILTELKKQNKETAIVVEDTEKQDSKTQEEQGKVEQ